MPFACPAHAPPVIRIFTLSPFIHFISHAPHFLSSPRHIVASVKRALRRPGYFPHHMQQCLRDNAHSNTQNAAVIWGCGHAGRSVREGTGEPGQACCGQKDCTVMWRLQSLVQLSNISQVGCIKEKDMTGSVRVKREFYGNENVQIMAVSPGFVISY